jgi:large subunit ribosomal protein L35
LKSHRGAAKRFKKTGTGKFLRGKASSAHPDRASLTRAQAPRPRGTEVVNKADQAKLKAHAACTTKQNLELQTLNSKLGSRFVRA